MSGVHPSFYHTIIERMIPSLQGKILLDCACGRGIYGFMLRIARGPELLVGIDLSRQHLKFCKFHKIYDDVVRASVTNLPIRDKEVDVVLASEIIEHLTKNLSERFFDEIDRVCKERAVVTTPNVQITTPDTELDAHKNYYSWRELKRRGYKTHGVGAKIKFEYSDSPIVAASYYILTPIAYIFPPIGGFLIGIKDFR